MTVISYTSDLSDINLCESTTGFSAYGGGGAGLSASYDFGVYWTSLAVDKQVSAAEKGFLYDNGSNFTIGADDHFYIWVRGATPGALDTFNNRGLVVCIGDGTSDFNKFHVQGSDTLPLGGSFPYSIRFVNTAESSAANRRTLVGTPGTTPSWIGCGANVTAIVKGANLGADVIRIGTGYDILGGTGADDPGSFTGIANLDDNTGEGIFTYALAAGIRLQGKLRFGDSSNACEITDSSILITIGDTIHSLSDFNEILIEHADSIIILDSGTFLGLGTNSPGRFEMITSAATVSFTGCTFQNFGDTVLGTGATMLGCNWINTDTITANGADLTGSSISGYEVAADTSPLIWDVATDPDGLLDSMTFTKGTLATHAIEFGTTSPLTMTLTDIDFNSYNASNGQNDSTFHVLRTSGTVTIYISGGSGNVSYKTAGATVVILAAPVTLTLTVTSLSTGSPISGARAYITPADNTGPYPWEESVTSITRVTTTATVTHTAHGMVDNQQVLIEGADQPEYNGIQTITNVSTNAYDYTVSGSPTTPATGTIIATAVIINEATTAGGVADDERSYTSDQPITGRIRQSTSSPLYKTSSVLGTIDSILGLSIALQMVSDE